MKFTFHTPPIRQHKKTRSRAWRAAVGSTGSSKGNSRILKPVPWSLRWRRRTASKQFGRLQQTEAVSLFGFPSPWLDLWKKRRRRAGSRPLGPTLANRYRSLLDVRSDGILSVGRARFSVRKSAGGTPYIVTLDVFALLIRRVNRSAKKNNHLIFY